MDPNIGYVNFSSIDLSPGDIQLLSFGLRLGGGLMLSDRLSLEAGVSSSRFRSDYNDTPVTQALVVNTDLMADLGLRFFVTEKGRFRPYAGAGVSGIYEFQNVEFEEAGQSNFTERNFDVAPYLQLGSLFFLSDKVALDASLEYHLINADNSAVYDNQLGLGVGVKVFLGREE